MPEILYYPTYTPEKKQLRSLLLFFDAVNLIVPSADQPNVARRRFVETLLAADESLIKFIDPGDRYHRWAADLEFSKLLDHLMRHLCDTGQSMHGNNKPAHKEHVENLLSIGRKPIAMQKVPNDIFYRICDARLGSHVGFYHNPKTQEIVEHDAVFMHPDVAALILSRLSREISSDKRIPSMTFEASSYVTHNFEKFANDPEYGRATNSGTLLLGVSIPLLIPDKIATMSDKSFLSIRNDFTDLRAHVGLHLSNLVSQHFLDGRTQTRNYLDRVGRAAEKIASEVDRTQRQISHERFRGGLTFACGAVAVSTGAYLSGFDVIGGALVGYIGTQIGRKITLGKNAPSSNAVFEFAKLKGSIERKHEPLDLKVPQYI